MTIVSPFLTFPPISWWQQAQQAGLVLLDTAEHYEKMTMRNRYRISGSNNPVLLSVPLINGRNQHVPMRDVHIHNAERWQVQHWRTLVSVYRRTPFFEHYEAALQPLFETEYDRLIDFARATMEWVRKSLRMKFELRETDIYQKEYPADMVDLRSMGKGQVSTKPYYQVFEDRIGFQHDLSILDLVFSEGPGAGEWLRSAP